MQYHPFQGLEQEARSLKINEQETEWFDTDRAAQYLGISAQALRNMVSNGKVPYEKLGRRNRYRKEEIRALIRPSRKDEAP